MGRDDAIPTTADAVRRRLAAEGWEEKRVTKHHVFAHPALGVVIVPKGRKSLATGTLRAIAKAAGWLGSRPARQES